MRSDSPKSNGTQYDLQFKAPPQPSPTSEKPSQAVSRPRRSEAPRFSDVPFVQRLTCTVAEACAATGLGRTKLYELIGGGFIDTTTIGRRRLVRVPSLLALVKPDARPS